MTTSILCSRRAADWRAQARHLREHAAVVTYLTDQQRASIRRNAELCDASAAEWQAAAENEEFTLG